MQGVHRSGHGGRGGARHAVSSACLYNRVFILTKLGTSSFYDKESMRPGQGIKCTINQKSLQRLLKSRKLSSINNVPFNVKIFVI